MRAIRLSGAIGAALLLATCCEAQLSFQRSTAELKLPVDVQEAAAEFVFTNTGISPVRLLRVETECDCIQTSIPGHAIGANETGVVSLKFRSKLRNGTEVVRARVIADNGEIHEISVNAKLRSNIEVTPQSLHWMKGEKSDAKEFTISSTGLRKLQFSRVSAVNGSKVELRRGEDPSTIRVRVTPPAADSPFRDVLLVSAVLEGTDETRIYDLHLRRD